MASSDVPRRQRDIGQTLIRCVLGAIVLGAVALPVVLFYRGFAPPLVPAAAWATAIVASLLFALGFGSTRPVSARGARWRGLAGLILLAVYGIGLSRWTAMPPAEREGDRVQVGFAMAPWSLTDEGRRVVADPELGVRNPQDLLLAVGGFTKDAGRPDEVWEFWSILLAGSILLGSLFSGVLLIADSAGKLLRTHADPVSLPGAGAERGGATWSTPTSDAKPAPVLGAGAQPARRRLLVVVPGIDGRLDRWSPLIRRLSEEPRIQGANILAFDHGARLYSLATLHGLATQLRARLDGEWAKTGGFDEVTLIGHSLGGLVVREAYLQKWESGSDLKARGWSGVTTRIVLLACPNRGLNPRRHPALRMLDWSFRMLPFLRGWVLYDLMRGSEFVTNLRIRWIQHFHRLGADAPMVVQMIGSKEEVVVRSAKREEDECADVEQSRRAWHITIPGARHGDLPDVIGADREVGCYALFLSGLLEDSPTDAENRAIHGAAEVFFVLHGIRAGNDGWVELAQKKIAAVRAGAPVHTPAYDRLSALKFALPLSRKRKTRWFQDRYAESLAENPEAKFYFLGHSNGTYLLGESLRTVPGMKFERVALAGSVLPCSFDWKPLRKNGRVQEVRNDRASGDVPVAILCSAMRGLYMRDVGLAGVLGFQDQNSSGVHEVYWHTGGHSQALQDPSLDDLVAFLVSGEVKKNAVLQPKLDWRFALLSRAAAVLAPLLVIGLIWLLVVWIGYGASFDAARLAWVLGTSAVAVLVLDLI